MNSQIRFLAIALVIISAAFLAGCEEVEPKTGTRVVLKSISGDKLTRQEINEASKYFLSRSRSVLGVPRARVERVTDNSIILLLPAREISEDEVARLLDQSNVAFYHLKNVSTKKHPNRKWQLKPQQNDDGSYLFLGPEATRINTITDSKDVLTEIAGTPEAKPILTGSDILPDSVFQSTERGWAVGVRFDKDGAKKFYTFSSAHSGEYVGVFHNDRLLSLGQIDKAIEGNTVFLTGFKSRDEASSAADILDAGTLPVPMRIESVEHY